jgi:hypothetical protein
LSGSRARGALAALAIAAVGALLGLGVGALASPAEDRILPLSGYTTEKARVLAKTHAAALSEMNAYIYHCVPWVETQKESIGFFKPKHLGGDDRYLAIRIFIEQDPSPAFAALDQNNRAAAMFSRYVGFLLRQMTKSPDILADPAVGGFIAVLEWRKQEASSEGRPIHETIAVYVPKLLARDYLTGKMTIDVLAQRARVMGWDGERALGQLHLPAWEDNFVTTFKLPNYKLDPAAKCS